MSLEDFNNDSSSEESEDKPDWIPEPSDDPNDVGYWIGDLNNEQK